MCGCGCLGSYPSDYGHIIAGLCRGEEIIIAASYGFPASQEDRREVVVDVEGWSALTNQGTALSCTDGVGVSRTGGRVQRIEFSDEARRILTELGREDVLNIEA